jgi:5-dehydro-2-deoxygluconokinase
VPTSENVGVSTGVEVVVMGRVSADLYPAPDQLRRPLRDIRQFVRYAGGFAANVATGLARLGVATAIASRVGEDGHGDFVRSFLAGEGVDVRWLATDPDLRTALAFCEIWPPEHFPITFYRTPTCPDWRLSTSDLDIDAIAGAPVLFTTGTALARSPSRETTLEVMTAHRGTCVFDLDYRPMLWEKADEYPTQTALALPLAQIVVGNSDELKAATGAESEKEATEIIRSSGPETVVAKRGSEGAAIYDADGLSNVGGISIDVVNGLGAGDAFAAALGYGLVRDVPLLRAVQMGNAAGAIVASAIPCSEAMPRLKDIESLIGA